MLTGKMHEPAAPRTKEIIRGWRHQPGKKQPEGKLQGRATLQMLKHTNPLDSGIILDNARGWIFPNSHGMRGKGKF